MNFKEWIIQEGVMSISKKDVYDFYYIATGQVDKNKPIVIEKIKELKSKYVRVFTELLKEQLHKYWLYTKQGTKRVYDDFDPNKINDDPKTLLELMKRTHRTIRSEGEKKQPRSNERWEFVAEALYALSISSNPGDILANIDKLNNAIHNTMTNIMLDKVMDAEDTEEINRLFQSLKREFDQIHTSHGSLFWRGKVSPELTYDFNENQINESISSIKYYPPTDRVKALADFYALNSMFIVEQKRFGKMDKKDELLNLIQEMKEDLVPYLKEIILSGVFGVIRQEMNHCLDKDMLYKTPYDFTDPLKMIKHAQYVFENGKFENEYYGGQSWANICEAWIMLYHAEDLSSQTVAIDHIVDLQHNTGSVFDKIGDWNLKRLTLLLRVKFFMKEPSDLFHFVSPTVQRVIRYFYGIIHKKAPSTDLSHIYTRYYVSTDTMDPDFVQLNKTPEVKSVLARLSPDEINRIKEFDPGFEKQEVKGFDYYSKKGRNPLSGF